MLFKYTLACCLSLAVFICHSSETATLRWHLGSPSRDRVQLETVELSDVDGRIVFKLPKEKVSEKAWALDVIPSFMTAKVGEDGWWMNGRGVYGKFTRTSGTNRWWRSQMPLFALKRGDVVWGGRVNTYRYDYDLMVESAKGEYAIYPRFRFDRVREYFPLYADVDVTFKKYHDATADDTCKRGVSPRTTGYVQIAKDYRESQFAAGVKPIKERVKEFPSLAYLSEAMVIRLQTHGAKSIPEKPTDFTKETEPPINVYMPFNVAEEFVEQVKAAGIDQAAFVSAGWNKGGYDGQLPEHFPVEPVLGGEKGLRRLVARAQNLGFMLMLHATHTEVYTVCPWFSEDYIAKKANGTRSWNGLYFGGSCYWICERASWDGWIPKEMQRMRDLGVTGNHYVDVFSATYPNRCADARHPATPEQMAVYQNNILAEAKRVFGGVSSEGGYDHVAANLDCINYVSTEMKKLHDGKIKGLELVDGVFPLWEIVYHGIILYNSDRFTQNHTRGQNHAKKDESGNLDWLEGDGIVDPRTTLKIAEFGGRPIFYTYKFKDIPAIKRAYDDFQPLKHLQTVLIDDHREVDPDLFVTRYENGEEVVVNYNLTQRTYRGHTIPALDYKIVSDASRVGRGETPRIQEAGPVLNYDFKGVFPASVKTVGLVMPASVFNRTKLDRAIYALKLAGYQVKLAPRLDFSKLASAKDRAADLVDVWTDPEVDLVLCVRGGSGAEKIVPYIDWERLRTRPEQVFLGFSDITILHNALLKYGVGRPISGPMISSIPRMTDVSRSWMARAIAREPQPTLQLHALKPGAFSGVTCGGHAHRFSVVLRQGESVDTKGKVVLLESECSIGVKVLKDTLDYLIDSGAMKDVAGVIFGDMTPGGGSSLQDERELKGEALAAARAEVENLKRRFAERVSCPVYDGFDYGHGAINYAVDHLRRVSVDAQGVMRWE